MPEINPHLYIQPLFIEADGTRIEAKSVEELVGKVAEYRKVNGGKSGNAMRDVVTQICERHPSLCRWPVSAPRPVKVQGQTRGTLNQRILAWVTSKAEQYLRGKLRFIRDKAVVTRRIAICKSCPKAKAWAHACAACKADVNRLGRELLAPTGPMRTRTAESDSLAGCSVLGEDPRTAVYLDEQAIPSNDLPGSCWRKA